LVLDTSDDERPIWLWVALASIVAAVWVFLHGVTTPVPEGARLDGTPGALGGAIGHALGSAIVPAVIVWAAFFLLIFRKRSAGKIMGALGMVILVASAVSVAPVFMAAERDARETPARNAILASQARVRQLTQRLNSDVEALNLRGDQARGIESREHVAAWMGRLRQAEALFINYNAAIDLERDQIQAQLASLDLDDRRRAEVDRLLEEFIGPNSLLKRVNAARARGMAKSAEMLAVLHDNPTRWTLERQTPVFTDEAILRRYQTVMEELRAIETERLSLEQQVNAEHASPPGGINPAE
jgi:hypothetical protein